MRLDEVVSYLDEYLKTKAIPDSSLNGLVLENSGYVKKIGLAVDFNLPVIELAAKEGVNFIIFHHGPYWGQPLPITGPIYKRIKALIENDIAFYVSHLPLDIHPEVGNNAVAMRLLGFDDTQDFGEYHGIKLGKKFMLQNPKNFDEFLAHLSDKIGKPLLCWKFGNDEIKTGAFASGDAISLLPEAIENNLDVLIVGEPRHYSYSLAKDAGINVVFMGHYQSETLGLKALGEHLKSKFNLPTLFLPEPTGL
ncbi:MAG: Nif3-like dinuclear metal center hexameric protein [candidate division WOR-3 bacterium]